MVLANPMHTQHTHLWKGDLQQLGQTLEAVHDLC
jgi:hypothetical protein